MRTPKHVLQVYHSVARYGPDRHNAAARRELGRWRDVVLSSSGAVEDGRVLLGEGTARPAERLASCDLVVLNDFNGGDASAAGSLPASPSLLSLPGPGSAQTARFSLFGLRESAAGGVELHLRYADNAAWIGLPRRADYRVAELRPGGAVRVRINGKTDFSLSGRRERRYLLAEFVFEYLGRFSTFEVQAEVRRAKHPPVAAARVVELGRVLY